MIIVLVVAAADNVTAFDPHTPGARPPTGMGHGGRRFDIGTRAVIESVDTSCAFMPWPMMGELIGMITSLRRYDECWLLDRLEIAVGPSADAPLVHRFNLGGRNPSFTSIAP
jgi:hypothetical protein